MRRVFKMNTFANLYFKVPRRLRFFIIFAFLIVAAYLFFYLLAVNSKIKEVPDEFLKARQEASIIAQDIIGFSNQTANNISKISELDKEAKYEDALNLIAGEVDHNRQAREKAISLSAQLEKMAKNISGIEPPEAAQIALQAISSETALISRLISYNDYLVQFLEVLRQKFSEDKNTNGRIAELVGKINEETKAINDLDENFNQLMVEFDKLR